MRLIPAPAQKGKLKPFGNPGVTIVRTGSAANGPKVPLPPGWFYSTFKGDAPPSTTKAASAGRVLPFKAGSVTPPQAVFTRDPLPVPPAKGAGTSQTAPPASTPEGGAKERKRAEASVREQMEAGRLAVRWMALLPKNGSASEKSAEDTQYQPISHVPPQKDVIL